jgi:hypothetical protein
MGFWNTLRETLDDRTFSGKPLQGWVVSTEDKKHNQQITVRIRELHKDIEDKDLPKFSPEQMAPFSGAANIGAHGPIPPKGTKVWVKFGDASQYHGTYGGAVINSGTQIPEFAGDKDTPVNLPGGSQYNFKDSYPEANGVIDQSGNLSATDTKTDVTVQQHVSGTSTAIDGKGNFSAVVNGNAERKDNENAKGIFPPGGTIAIFGNLTLHVSGKINVSCSGDTSITTTGKTSIESKDKISIVGAEQIDITSTSTSKPLNLASKYMIQLEAPIIISSVPVVPASTDVKIEKPSDVSAQSAPSGRTRPNPTIDAKISEY